MGFSRQKYWNGLPFPPPGDLPSPGIEPTSAVSQMICNPSSPFSIFDGVYRLKERRGRTNGNGSLEENDHPGSHHSLRFPTRLRFSASDHSLVFCSGLLALGFTKGLCSSQADLICPLKHDVSWASIFQKENEGWRKF